jgi:hypothetical protein
MTAKFNGGFHRTGNQGSVDSAAVSIRAHANPSQRGILESGLSLPRAGMGPGDRARGSIAIERRKWLPQRGFPRRRTAGGCIRLLPPACWITNQGGCIAKPRRELRLAWQRPIRTNSGVLLGPFYSLHRIGAASAQSWIRPA